MPSKRFLIVAVDSSAARMPRPLATIAVATLFNSLRSIAPSSISPRRAAALFMLSRGRLRGGNQQHFYARQCLAFQRFQERAAAGRHVRHPVLDRGKVE